MRLYRFLPVLGLALCAATNVAPLAAQAERHHYQSASGTADVTIRTPVELSSIDAQASQAAVYCVATFVGDDARVQAKNQSIVNLTNGAYSGTIDVKLTLSVAQSGEKWTYDCKLELYNAKAAIQWAFANTSNIPWSMAKAGTTPTTTNSGTITVQ